MTTENASTPEPEPTLEPEPSSLGAKVRQRISQIFSGLSENDTDHALELFKLEYERAAERYENIYRAIWQNFYYMAVLAGGIIAFGPREAFPLALLAAVALVPLVVWFWATFLPMDRYGQLTRARLAFIEHILNKTFLEKELGDDWLEYKDKRLGKLGDRKRLRHYQLFYEPKPDEDTNTEPNGDTRGESNGDGGANSDGDTDAESDEGKPSERIRPTYRVRTVVCVFGAIVTTLCILFSGWSLGSAIASRLDVWDCVLWPTLAVLTLVWAVILFVVIEDLQWYVSLTILVANVFLFLTLGCATGTEFCLLPEPGSWS